MSRSVKYVIAVCAGTGHFFRPIAKTFFAVRAYRTPSESAGVAISVSPMSFAEICVNFVPAAMTLISPSSLET